MSNVLNVTDFELAEPFMRLARDTKAAARLLKRGEARWLVDTYYQMQDGRIRSGNQLRKQQESAEPGKLIEWVFETWKRFEGAIKAALGEFAATYRVGQWLQAQTGIGPVLSAAMLCNFDIRKGCTVGHFWRFAGLDPTCIWEKGKKRPYNAQLKAICAYKMGECFVKFQNHEHCYYGHLFAAKKTELVEANAAGKFADFAAKELERVQADKALWNKMKDKPRIEDWKAGRICPANIHDRARRWAVKLFISHLHEVMYRDFNDGKMPPAPFIFEHPENGDHRHKLEPQRWPGEYDGKPLRELLIDQA